MSRLAPVIALAAALAATAAPRPARALRGNEDTNFVLRLGEAFVPFAGSSAGAPGRVLDQTSIAFAAYGDLHPSWGRSLLGHRLGLEYGLQAGWILPATLPPSQTGGKAVSWSGGPDLLTFLGAPWDVVETGDLRLSVGPGIRFGLEAGRHPFVGQVPAFDADAYFAFIADYAVTGSVRILAEYQLAAFGYQYTEHRLRVRLLLGHFTIGADVAYGLRDGPNPYVDVAACIGLGGWS